MAEKGKKTGKGNIASKNEKQQLDPSQGKEQKAGDVALVHVVTQKELFLQGELKSLKENLDMLVRRLRSLHLDNDFLEEEAKRIQLENKEYVSYLAKHARRNRGLIIRLSDQNKKELEEVQAEMLPMFVEYEKKGKELQSQLKQKEHELAGVVRETEELQPMRKVQAENLAEIKKLEMQVLSMRVRYADSVQMVKNTFLREKETYEKEAEMKVQKLSRSAMKEAQCSLIKLTMRAQEDNRKLSHKVLHLIRRLTILKALQLRLLAQNKKILEEVQHTKQLAHWHQRRLPLLGTPVEEPMPEEYQRCKDLAELRYILKHSTIRKTATAKEHHQYGGLQYVIDKYRAEGSEDLSTSEVNMHKRIQE
ncbi:hypothetical protein NDU88_004206 [Pleurodeles waltl]|uniref:DUF4515 domain-containing protein n=1 Tax=Pleurodeles waltl TaxID=8319 RepID=A0AAV7V2U6_PLEWA|nr:hypothetical protein NDU88_004206 [Pleurodeles waltl]